MVCEGERTCCPAGVEASLRQSAASDFHHAVRQSSHQLRHTLAQSATAIQGKNFLRGNDLFLTLSADEDFKLKIKKRIISRNRDRADSNTE